MKWFGKRREASRPALARAYGGTGVLGEWPQSYEAQVREGYCANPVAQRAVKIIAESVADAPLAGSDPALLALVNARTQGQELIAALAAQLLLHGNAFVQILGDGAGGIAELFALRPEPLGGNRWRLSRLWRGRRGTEAAAGTAIAGDRFVLIDPATLTSRDGIAGIGANVTVLGTAPADGEGVEVETQVTGASVLPPAPVHLRFDRLPGGEIRLRWARRSRAGWRWQDGIEVPLGEEVEQYRVRITPSVGDELAETVAMAELLLPGGLVAPIRVEVRQIGDHGQSPPAFLTI